MLDKNARKAYNEKKGSIFDEDDIADSALSYLYNDANKIKTQSFLKSNGNIHIHVDGEKIFLNTVDDIQDLSKGIRKSDKVVDWIKKAFQLFNKLT